MFLSEEERDQAAEQCDLVIRVLPGLCNTLHALRQEALEITGLTLEQWRALSFEEREQAQVAGRKQKGRRKVT